MNAEKLDELAALAEKATPGPWKQSGGSVGSATVNPICDAGWPTPAATADAVFIAACDPDTIRLLVEAARLGVAWQEAEAALPEGWVLDMGSRPWAFFTSAFHLEGGVSTGYLDANGPTAAAALHALAVALRERAP